MAGHPWRPLAPATAAGLGRTVNDERMRGKICIVTGANRGIGRATAMGLAGLGATVVLVCRNQRAGDDTRAAIRHATGNEAVHVGLADLAVPHTLRQFADGFLGRFPRLDVLLHNAATVPRERTLTSEGLELQFAVNHLAPFLLTHLLVARLRASAPARVVTVASEAHRAAKLDLQDLQAARRYGQFTQYANTKLMNIMFTYELARRLDRSGVTANCLHPGIVATGLAQALTPLPRPLARAVRAVLKSPARGAGTSIYLAAAPAVRGVSGRYFANRREKRSASVSYDPEAQRALWQASAELARLDAAAT